MCPAAKVNQPPVVVIILVGQYKFYPVTINIVLHGHVLQLAV